MSKMHIGESETFEFEPVEPLEGQDPLPIEVPAPAEAPAEPEPVEEPVPASRLSAGMLAQFRGCEPWNQCYADCVNSAQWTIDEGEDPDEIAEAWEWAKRQEWVPSLESTTT